MSDKFIYIMFVTGWALMLIGMAAMVVIAAVESAWIAAWLCLGFGLFLIYSLQYKDGTSPRSNPWGKQ